MLFLPADKKFKENATQLEDFKKEIAEMKLFGLPKNNGKCVDCLLNLLKSGNSCRIHL